MINYHTQLVDTLSSVLPTHYELFLKSGLDTPCISYQESNNYTEIGGDSLGYAQVTYTVKVWAKRMSDIQTYAARIDDALRPLGWRLTASGELTDGTMIQKILTYNARFKEIYDEV